MLALSVPEVHPESDASREAVPEIVVKGVLEGAGEVEVLEQAQAGVHADSALEAVVSAEVVGVEVPSGFGPGDDDKPSRMEDISGRYVEPGVVFEHPLGTDTAFEGGSEEDVIVMVVDHGGKAVVVQKSAVSELVLGVVPYGHRYPVVRFADGLGPELNPYEKEKDGYDGLMDAHSFFLQIKYILTEKSIYPFSGPAHKAGNYRNYRKTSILGLALLISISKGVNFAVLIYIDYKRSIWKF